MKKEDCILHKTYLLSYNLQFFAENTAGDKTEDATSKKLSDARKEGQVAKSKELITAAALTALFLVLKTSTGFIANRFLGSMRKSFNNIDKVSDGEFNIQTMNGILSDAILDIIWTCIPVFITAMMVSFVVILAQVKWKVSGKLLKPKFNKINPISGFKKIFSKDKLVDLIIEVVKIALISYIAYDTLKSEWKTLMIFYAIELEQAIYLIGQLVIDLGIRISIIFLVIGFADLFYQKMKFKNDMKMSKQEVKDEYKNSEGNPQIKSKIRSKMREVSQKRMMQSIPQADVIITNPTHLAAAIKYDRENSEAPVLLAKGADYLALKIREIAKDNNIEIVENKPLARMLYHNVEVGAEIPPELYQMTAEVLAYVYGLKNK
jgi:flagellar biosynthetic protein FlhB